MAKKEITKEIPEKPTAIKEPLEKVAVEKGEVSPSQMQEIELGQYYTTVQLAKALGYSKFWITTLIQTGRIKAIKPIGGHWRIPRSEYVRVTTEGLPPLPREAKKPPIEEIDVPEEKLKKIIPEPKKKGERSFFDISRMFID